MESKCYNCLHWAVPGKSKLAEWGECKNSRSNSSGMITKNYHDCPMFEPALKPGEKFEPFQIPEAWTFKSDSVAKNFDSHVREQLPFYDLATDAVVHAARHYIPKLATVYDIGAATGNMTMKLVEICLERTCNLISVEESPQMLDVLNVRMKKFCDDRGVSGFYEREEVKDALTFQFEQFDFAVAFLTVMFFPVAERRGWLNRMRSLINPGGALVLVEKIVTPPGYAGTVLRRLSMDWKLKNGASPEAIVKKELSLAGYQRPLCERMLESFGAVKFFQLGEFAGWIIERGE